MDSADTKQRFEASVMAGKTWVEAALDLGIKKETAIIWIDELESRLENEALRYYLRTEEAASLALEELERLVVNAEKDSDRLTACKALLDFKTKMMFAKRNQKRRPGSAASAARKSRLFTDFKSNG